MIKIDHLGIAVPDLDEALRAYEALGLAATDVADVPTEKIRVAFLPVGQSTLELMEPTDESSPVARFLQKRAGLHHVCFLVDDLDATLASLKARGVDLIDETPRRGARGSLVAFVHPRSASGVLIELKQKAAP